MPAKVTVLERLRPDHAGAAGTDRRRLGYEDAYAGITKGFTALGAAMMLAATRAGTAEALQAELSSSQPALFNWLTRQMPRMYSKAYRWVAEMEEMPRSLEGFSGCKVRTLGAARLSSGSPPILKGRTRRPQCSTRSAQEGLGTYNRVTRLLPGWPLSKGVRVRLAPHSGSQPIDQRRNVIPRAANWRPRHCFPHSRGRPRPVRKIRVVAHRL